MKAFASVRGGLCSITMGAEAQVIDVRHMTPVSDSVAHLLGGVLDDWEVVEGANRDAVLGAVRDRHYMTRAVANIEVCLIGVSKGLRLELLEEVEDLLKAKGAHDQVVAQLLRAPLVPSEDARGLVAECLAQGLGATGHALEEVTEAQPLIQRFADRWMSIAEREFDAIPGGRQQAWRMAVSSMAVLATLHANSYSEVEQSWAELAFRSSSPSERAFYARISKSVAHALFPNHQTAVGEQDIVALAAPSVDEKDRKAHRSRSGHENYQSVLRQVDAISVAVARGQDAQARKYLHDLVDAQVSDEGGAQYAVKSLCNIAQQCADMFRTDFEYECLETAIRIQPSDPWTLVQYADHHKRVGRFEDAIRYLEDAQALGPDRVVQSSLADVYVQMGRFDEGLSRYKNIPGWRTDPSLRQAVADVLRRRGDLDAALAEYHAVISDGMETNRTRAGIAEIAKRRGRLEEARELYEKIVAETKLDDRPAVVYRLALANVLVRMGAASEAYQILDEVVTACPFARQARAFRAAVVGLLGDGIKAIGSVPSLGRVTAVDEWVNDYIRGLLLLMLGRYNDAKDALLQNVDQRLLDSEAIAKLGLGAAVWYLRDQQGVENAARILDALPEMKDAFVDTIKAALQYHVAVSLRQATEIRCLSEGLAGVEDADVRGIVRAVEAGEWRVACELEVRVLLRLAA